MDCDRQMFEQQSIMWVAYFISAVQYKNMSK